jgi:hypothetical protein
MFMKILPAAGRINAAAIKPTSPVKVISNLDPERIDRRQLGDKAWGCALLHTAQPHIHTPYIPVDGLVLPCNHSLSDIKQQAYDAFQVATGDVQEKAVLMARGTRFEEEHGKTKTLYSLFDPDKKDWSFKAFFANALNIHDPQTLTAVIGQFMVGQWTENSFGIDNVSFHLYSPDPKATARMIIDLVQGINLQAHSRNNTTFTFWFNKERHEIVDYRVFCNQYFGRQLEDRLNQDFLYAMRQARGKLKTERTHLEQTHLRGGMIFPGIDDHFYFPVSEHELDHLRDIGQELEQKCKFPIEAEGSILGNDIFLYQLGKNCVDPALSIDLSDEPTRKLLTSQSVRGVWNGELVFVIPVNSINDLKQIPTLITVLKQRYPGRAIGLALQNDIDDYFMGLEQFIQDLNVFATSQHFTAANHLLNQIRGWIAQGLPLTYMQGVDFDPDKLKLKADKIIDLCGTELMVFENAKIESNGSQAQLLIPSLLPMSNQV